MAVLAKMRSQLGRDMDLWIIIIGSFASITFLIGLTICTCCAAKRQRKEKSKEKPESNVKSVIEEKRSVKCIMPSMSLDTKSERSQIIGSRTKSIRDPSIQSSPTINAVTAPPMTVILAEPRDPKKTDAKPVSPMLTPFKRSCPMETVQYNDPAYRTLALDIDDPFSERSSSQRSPSNLEVQKVNVLIDALKKLAINDQNQQKDRIPSPSLTSVSINTVRQQI